MTAPRRLGALLVLILQVVVGMRPVVVSSAIASASVERIIDCHGNEAPLVSREEAGDTSHLGHDGMMPPSDAVAPTSAPGAPDEDAPAPRHSSHHDSGCHGAPCCAPVLPLAAERLPSSSSAMLGFQRPLSGAARIIWADGARFLPPATAPPVSLLA